MRQIHIPLAALAAATLATAPVAAQGKPTPTIEESVQCMMVTLPFLLVATVNNPDAVEGLDNVGSFWAQTADSLGEPAEGDMDSLDAQLAEMTDGFDALETEADFAAYLAPYQAKFDACEEKRKAMQAG